MVARMRAVAMAVLLAMSVTGCPDSNTGEYQSCLPDCDGRQCGDDGCGGSCGSCADPFVCSSAGQCVDDSDLGSSQDQDVASTFDVRVPDGSVEQICQSLYLQYQDALTAGAECDTALDCNVTIGAGDPCHCALYVSNEQAKSLLAAIETQYVENGCAQREMCDACPWVEVPVCNHGVCASSKPSCPEIEGQYKQNLLIAQQCESDDDCTGRVPGALDCDCEVPTNASAWTGYFELAQELWNTSECGTPLDCSCAVLLDVACLDGICGVPAE